MAGQKTFKRQVNIRNSSEETLQFDWSGQYDAWSISARELLLLSGNMARERCYARQIRPLLKL